MIPYITQLLQAPTSAEWTRFVEITAGILVTFGVGEAVRVSLRWPPEFTRKLVHISVAILIFFAPRLFVSAVPPLILAATFTLFAYGAIKLGLLKSLHAVARGAYGTVYYPLSFLILVLLFWNSHPEIVSLSMIVMGLGDASAAIVGESIRNPVIFHLTSDKKSIQGSAAMFLATAIGLTAGLVYFDGASHSAQTMAIAIGCAAIIATAWEALSSRALDNLTVPLSVSFVLSYVLVPSPMRDNLQFAWGTGLGIAIGIVAYYARFLKASGAVSTFLLASLVYGVGGWKWTTPILTFFILSSVLSKMRSSRKKEAEALFDKTGTRDAGQVAANGGVAGILVLLSCFFQRVDLYPVYLAAVAAVTADTWGTEIGTLVSGRTASIATFSRVAPGTNGGVSAAGMAAAIVGAFVIAMSAMGWHNSWTQVLLITVSGAVGSVVDSVVGGTIQGRYLCRVCGKTTERTAHCGTPADLVGGIPRIDNDLVNWVCAAAGAGAMILLGGMA